MYVDGFKLVGCKQNLENDWASTRRSGLVLNSPTPLGDYLGCGQFPIALAPEVARVRMESMLPLLDDTVPDFKMEENNRTRQREIRAIRYNMSGFFEQCIELYCNELNEMN